ncbi:YbaB/EbfC family nucleoid-associated protein [Saccharothrix sp. AJ9571]|nr:YbaB/EbfC family nucleoid-associated protein [Saccharothrix sp. AJ9571]
MSDPYQVPDMNALLEEVRAQTEQVQRIQKSVEKMEVKGYSRGNEVVATLRGDGRFTDISIDPETVRRFPARELGEIVLEAVNNGLTKLGEASRAKFAPVIDAAGAGTPQQ